MNIFRKMMGRTTNNQGGCCGVEIKEVTAEEQAAASNDCCSTEKQVTGESSCCSTETKHERQSSDKN
ncbi:hypothetical protein [Paenibacillus caui]|uniref:hypothetical protein n=1 Tax=Paenibacillus caui TaxID=2873927 RepID=UPI001CA82276|nr:hypothetical protein [Paenibacillus caui]